jgi:hypothetical protein
MSSDVTGDRRQNGWNEYSKLVLKELLAQLVATLLSGSCLRLPNLLVRRRQILLVNFVVICRDLQRA